MSDERKGLDGWLPTTEPEFYGIDRSAGVNGFLTRYWRESWHLRVRKWIARKLLRLAVE